MAQVKTVTMNGPAGDVVVNEADVGAYEQKGYKVVEATSGSNDGSGGTTTEETGEKALADMTMKELRAHAKSLGMTGYTKLAQDELIAAIEAHEPDENPEE